MRTDGCTESERPGYPQGRVEQATASCLICTSYQLCSLLALVTLEYFSSSIYCDASVCLQQSVSGNTLEVIVPVGATASCRRWGYQNKMRAGVKLSLLARITASRLAITTGQPHNDEWLLPESPVVTAVVRMSLLYANICNLKICK